MVIYTYLVPKLFFLNLLLHIAELFDGLVGLLTLGFVHPCTNYPIFMRLCSLEYQIRLTKTKDKRTYKDVWPRKQIWPALKPPVNERKP
jgi:hypothetical protein